MNRAFAWPVGHGRRTQSPVSLTVLYVIGLVLGGLFTGSILAGISVLLVQFDVKVAALPILLVAALAVVAEARGKMGPFPQLKPSQ